MTKQENKREEEDWNKKFNDFWKPLLQNKGKWSEQYKNRPQTKLYKFKTLREWSEISGIKLKTLRSRIYRGQPISKAIIK